MRRQSWKSSIEREENCKSCKTVKILTAIIMAKGYCPPEKWNPNQQKTGLLNEHIVHGDDLDDPHIQKPDLSSLTCLQGSVLV